MKKWVSLFLAVTMLFALSLPVFAAESEAQEAAQTLHELGLFKGTGTDAAGKPVFDLNRAPTRAEAVTMLVRLLGKEDEALAGDWNTPFIDVADWAKPYVGYAYANGLTAGVSQTRFGSESSVTAAQFLTFVLRALGYESGKDFSWDSAWTLTDTLGMTSGQYNAKTNGSFLRADAALVSCLALGANEKNGKTLYETIFGKSMPQTLSDTIDRLAGRTPKRDTSRAAAGYGTYLDTLHLPDILGKPQYSQAEIRQMLDYSLDELRDAIYTVPDMIQYIVESGYGVEPKLEDDIHFEHGGYDWSVNKSAQGALLSNCPSCGAISNLTRYILQDDYDEEGYVFWFACNKTENLPVGGHVFNYYRVGGEFVTFDYTSVEMGRIADGTPCRVVNDFSGIKEEVLREQSPELSMHTIFVDRDPQRDHVAVSMNHAGKACLFVDARNRDHVVLLYQDEAWQKACPSFEYHPFFEEAVQISEADYPSYVFDGSSSEEVTALQYDAFVPQSNGLVLCWLGVQIVPGWGFGVVEDGDTTAVYWNKQRLTDFTFTVRDPANCTVTKGADGVLTFTNVKDNTALTITGPAGSAEFIISTR